MCTGGGRIIRRIVVHRIIRWIVCAAGRIIWRIVCAAGQIVQIIRRIVCAGTWIIRWCDVRASRNALTTKHGSEHSVDMVIDTYTKTFVAPSTKTRVAHVCGTCVTHVLLSDQ